MILAGVLGWSLRFLGYENHAVLGVLLGLLVVTLVPMRSATAPGENRPGPAR